MSFICLRQSAVFVCRWLHSSPLSLCCFALGERAVILQKLNYLHDLALMNDGMDNLLPAMKYVQPHASDGLWPQVSALVGLHWPPLPSLALCTPLAIRRACLTLLASALVAYHGVTVGSVSIPKLSLGVCDCVALYAQFECAAMASRMSIRIGPLSVRLDLIVSQN